jgi:DNA-binding HxlR family transcriptional regulator
MQKGIGEYQIKKAKASKKEILKVLQDGQWHRYNEIKEATGLSSATLSKHLEELTNGIVEKKLDLESKQYPYPVLYRLNPNLQKTVDIWRNFLLSHVEKSGNFWLKTDKPEKPFQSLANLTILAFIDLLKQEQSSMEYFEQAFQYTVLSFFEESLKILKQKLETLEPRKRIGILEKIEQNLAGVKV